MNEIVRTCACGASYTLEEWKKLVFAYRQVIPSDPEHPDMMFAEFRHCSCRSTISIDLLKVSHDETLKAILETISRFPGQWQR